MMHDSKRSLRPTICSAVLGLTAVAASGAVALAAGTPGDEAQTSWKIFAEQVYTEPGNLLENCLLLVQDGKVKAIAAGRSAPDDEDVISVACVTAGMIDASAGLHTGFTSVEQSKEIQPHRRAQDSIDLFDHRWDRQARSGVTTTIVTPYDRNVIGGLGVAVKTAGSDLVPERIVAEDVCMRGAIGSLPSSGNRPWGQPTDFYQRRPTTRMGVEWEWRKSMYDAGFAAGDEKRAFEGSAELGSVLAGETPLCIQAWATQDVRTAIFLKEEMQAEGFGEIRLIVDAAAEAWKEPDLLVRTDTAVILPPFSASGRTNDGAFMAWDSAKTLVDLGIRVALSSHGAKSAGARLANQAGFAMRGGLTLDEALAAVTTAPAEMFGIGDRVGTVRAGGAADLVLWNGTPFEATSRIVGVLVDGNLVLDPR
ncbi:MAG: imidazolonepropionase-like amidohydrolase [Chlamydiales bacterium]|jgi:imidazolonepropionase-like amidohydrolase